MIWLTSCLSVDIKPDNFTVKWEERINPGDFKKNINVSELNIIKCEKCEEIFFLQLRENERELLYLLNICEFKN